MGTVCREEWMAWGDRGATPLSEVPRGGPSRRVSCVKGTAFYNLTGVS